MKRSIFFVCTVFAGAVVGAGLGAQAWGVGDGGLLGALAGGLLGAAVVRAGLRLDEDGPAARAR